MNLFVANIPFTATDAQLKELFEMHGQVASAKIVIDRETQRSRGIGFVEMPNSREAEKAIAEVPQTQFFGRTLHVEQAKERQGGSRPSYGGGNRGGSNRDYGREDRGQRRQNHNY